VTAEADYRCDLEREEHFNSVSALRSHIVRRSKVVTDGLGFQSHQVGRIS